MSCNRGSAKYVKPGEGEFQSYDEDGRAIDGYVTTEVERDGTFGIAAHRLARATARPDEKSWESNRPIPGGLLMTTESCWSGYSEYTVTNEWSEIVLTIPEWNWEHRWESVGDFFRAMAAANPEEDR